VSLVAIVGIGEDGAAGLLPDARAAVEAAEILVGGERHHQFFPRHPAERIVFHQDAAELAESIAALAATGRRVTVLASGDPMFFGIGSVLSHRLGADQVHIYPHVGSIQLAFARIGEAWEDATLVSAHGRPLERVVQAALGAAKLAVLTDPLHTPAAIASALLTAGVERDAAAWVLERLGGAAERVRSGRLEDVPTWTADRLSLLVVQRDPTQVRGPAPRFGLPDASYAHERGQITKAEVRAISLARLAPRSGDVVWDVGAGSGSVSLEAAAFCSPGLVYAIERRAEQRACIAENITRFGATNVRIVDGEAPWVLAELPDPDSVFIGGSGGLLREIVQVSLRRLRSGGRLVINLATLEALHEATSTLSIPHEVAQVSIARGVPIEGATRLAALNPVFVVSARLERR
jgi:precorrin-6Y C5,15-methyltransferase (decarboxylating)